MPKDAYHEDDYLFAAPANSRTWMLQGDLWADEPTHRNKFSRIVVFIISGLLMCAGIALAIIGRLQKDEKLLPLCPHCDDLIVALYVIGSVIAAIGLLGIVAAGTRLRVLAFTYAVVLVLITLVMLAAGIAVIVYRSRADRSDLHELWTDAVKDDPQFICEFQSEFECSGYLVCCGINCEGTIEKDCVETCQNNDKYKVPCADQAQSEVREHLAEVLGAFFGFAVLLMITTVATIRMVLKS